MTLAILMPARLKGHKIFFWGGQNGAIVPELYIYQNFRLFKQGGGIRVFCAGDWTRAYAQEKCLGALGEENFSDLVRLMFCYASYLLGQG